MIPTSRNLIDLEGYFNSTKIISQEAGGRRCYGKMGHERKKE